MLAELHEHFLKYCRSSKFAAHLELVSTSKYGGSKLQYETLRVNSSCRLFLGEIGFGNSRHHTNAYEDTPSTLETNPKQEGRIRTRNKAFESESYVLLVYF